MARRPGTGGGEGDAISAEDGIGNALMVAASVAAYVNFDLLIEKDDGKYRARVVSDSGTDARGMFTTPFTLEDFERLADQTDRSRRTRRMVTPQLSLAKDMGGRLHEAVFHDEISVSFARARDEAERKGAAGVRIRLHLAEAPDLAVLPWEFLFDPDPRVGRFLALAEETPLVRYVDLPDKIRPLKVHPPIRVLGVVANPADDRYPELDVEREWKLLEEALAQPIADGRLELLRLSRPTVSNLQDTLAATESNILHFIGHGRFDVDHQDGVLAFEGERGGVNEISAERLGTLLYNERSLRLVVLNACEGGRASATDPYAGMAQTLARMRVPAVVAMQFEITDRAAIIFARQFYKGIALGRPVDAAITDARMAIYQQVSEMEWATPVLYMRSPDGAIFDVPESGAPVIRSATDPAPVVALRRATPDESPATAVRAGLSARKLVLPLALGFLLVAGGIIATRVLPPVLETGTGGASPQVTVLTAPPTQLPISVMRVVQTIPAGQKPDGIAVDERAGRIYVVNGDVGQVRILDASTRTSIGIVQVTGQPVDVAVDPSLDRVYVTLFKANALAVLDRTGRSLGTIPVAGGAFAVTIHPDTHRVYVANQLGNSVSVIDATSLNVLKTISVGLSPSGIAINPRTSRAYVVNLQSRNLTVIDTVQDVVIGSVSLDAAPGRVAVALSGNLVLITNPFDDSVTIISGQTEKVLQKIPVGRKPLGIAVDPARDRAYVAVEESGTVGVIDLSKSALDHVVTLSANPARLVYNTASKQLYVVNFGSGTISVIE
jgi:YVTN family beta-propeller protein